MLRKKITAWVLTAAMLTGLGAAAPVTAFAQTAEDVQQNRCYINGDEVRKDKYHQRQGGRSGSYPVYH